MTAILLAVLSQWTGPGLGTQGGNLSSTAPLQLLESGVKRGAVSELNFTGAGVTSCTRSGNRGTCTIAGGGGGGAPTDATYITQTANATLTNEQALSSLSTGVVKVTTGTGVLSTAVSGTDYAPATSGSAVLLGNGAGGFSSYAGATCGANQYATATSTAGALTCSQVATSQLSGTITNGQLASTYSGVGTCTNQFARALNGNAAPTCATVSLTADVTGTLGQGNGGLGAASLTCGAGDYVTCNGTVCSCSTPAGGSGYNLIQDEGGALTARTTLNFAGAGVTCADDTTRTTCTIAGGGGGGTSPLILTFGGF